MALLERPGSFYEFQDENPEAEVTDYSKRLAEYREDLARDLGVTPDQLHSMGPKTVLTMLALDEAAPEE